MNSEGCRFTRLRARALYEKAGWNVSPAELGRQMRKQIRHEDPFAKLQQLLASAIKGEEPPR
jgi:hypothetical protein